ncbi:MAG: dTDP-4-dehydrorhamnose 3,5-epimerase family protein [Ilumatobacteraceae bacterium]
MNLTETRRGAVRGMHAEQMTKLVTVASGEAFRCLRRSPSGLGDRAVVTVDLRPGVQVLVPSGVANGFQALTDGCQYLYCFDTEWQPGMAGQACSPLGAGIEWPIAIDPDDPLQLSTKDRTAPLLADVVSEDS